eukprot:COSAG02_NODE_2479_length_8728_cov_361.338741_2_plen_352_part_00
MCVGHGATAESSTQGGITRVTDGLLGGHVHPSICVAPSSGDVIVVFNRGPGDANELLLCRSTDKGVSWTEPVVLPSSVDRCPGGVYPGALTVLKSGEIVLHWYRYGPTAAQRWQYGPEYCVSSDDGHAFGPPQLIDTPDRPDGHTQPEGRFPFLELDDETWVLPLYDRTVAYNRRTGGLATWGDGRNHGMVPLVRTPSGTLVSGAPQLDAPAPVGKPDPSGEMVYGLRSSNSGMTWQPLHQLGHFGVCGYDLTVLTNGWIVHTAVIYGVGVDGEYAYELWLSRDDGLSFDRDHGAVVYNPGRRITGRGWPRTVQLDDKTLGTLFYDLTQSPEQAGGPSLWFQTTLIEDLLP